MAQFILVLFVFQTIVTSTTLTGRSQQMEADAGDKYQIDVLSNADAWVPKENENPDVSNFFISQQVYHRTFFLYTWV